MALERTAVLVADLRSLLGALPRRRRLQLALLAGLILAGAIAEMLSLGTLVPFLAVLADPEKVLRDALAAKVAGALRIATPEELRWWLTLLFGVVAVVANAMRFALVYAISRLTYHTAHELGAEVYRRTLYQPYEVHVARNSSELLAGIGKVDAVAWMLLSLLSMLGAIVIALFIIATLLIIDPVVATTALVVFSGIYAAASVLTRSRLVRNSGIISAASNERLQCMQEGLGGIRDILLDHSQPVFEARFKKIDLALRQAQAGNNIAVPIPRFAVEALGMVLIALVAYLLTSSAGGVGAVIPTLGALALGAQRLMPLLQAVYQGWASVTGERQVMRDVIGLLEQPVDAAAERPLSVLPFRREIRFQNVSFQYQPDAPRVLQSVDLAIAKGARIGLAGPTGSGKSTAMDILLGLLQPTEGEVVVDDVPLVGLDRLRWQRNIAHVPQSIFLADASFAENIAFGLPSDRIDMERVRRAAQEAQIAEFIESNPLGYGALIGERGIRLSGGQRQRLGIARALYRNAKVLVFDEATSALDSETEAAVMQAIETLRSNLTIILIAHRTTTLRQCDTIYKLQSGRVVAMGDYASLFEAARGVNTGKAGGTPMAV